MWRDARGVDRWLLAAGNDVEQRDAAEVSDTTMLIVVPMLVPLKIVLQPGS
jgi:hypothetical protein